MSQPGPHYLPIDTAPTDRKVNLFGTLVGEECLSRVLPDCEWKDGHWYTGYPLGKPVLASHWIP